MAARRGGLKALCQMEDEHIGNILYEFRDPRDRAPLRIPGLKCPKKLSTKPANRDVHAARRATNWRTARGLQLSEIENHVA